MKKVFAFATMILATISLSAQTADEIVDKHIAATGGKENLSKVTSAVSEGGLNLGGMELAVKVTVLHMKGSRQDISVAGMNNFIINTPTSGFNYLPIQGMQNPEPMTAEEVKSGMDELDIQGVLLDYKAKGHAVELAGTEEIEGTECYKLIVNRKNSGIATYFIDKDSYMVVRQVTKRVVAGQEMEISVDLADYKEVGGIMMPHSITQPGLGTIVLTSVKLNESVDESIFSGKL